jgi:hypothetical protein
MALLGQSTEKAELLKTGQDDHRNEALRHYPDQWQEIADLPHTRYEPSHQLSMAGCAQIGCLRTSHHPVNETRRASF